MSRDPFPPDPARVTIQSIQRCWPSSRDVALSMLRLDQIHPEISGNKWFKLKYNLRAAAAQGKNTVLTFGGAWSNHIAATAALCAQAKLGSIGLIRGEEPALWSHTLLRAREQGMRIEFVSRQTYRDCAAQGHLPSGQHYGEVYIIPEGGGNALGVKGCEEILHIHPTGAYSHLCSPVGTGTTLRGLIRSAGADQQVLGFIPMKRAAADRLRATLFRQLGTPPAAPAGWQLFHDEHFGGFARKSDTLLEFMHEFRDRTGVPLDFIYTARMIYALIDRIRSGYFPKGSRLLAIHTGGLQGNASLETIDQKAQASC